MKVLIVEDTDSVQYALRLALEFLGHEVVACAADGLEALEKYSTAHPDVVMMDVRMPRMDGLTATSKLLKEHDPQAKVIIITGGRSTEVDAQGVGARAFVEKPFELERLDQVIHGLG
jgi:two-component system chemotaxis response regulator CheY